MLAGWPEKSGVHFGEIAQLAGWPSPNTPSGGRSVAIEKMDASGRMEDGRKHTASLEHAVKFAGWPTPMAGTPAQKGYNEVGNTESSRRTEALVGKDIKGHGLKLNGSPAATGNIGQLNPEFSRYLMGLPPEWDACAPTATRSASRKRSNS